MKIDISFQHLSLTHLQQERSVARTILAQTQYSENYQKVELPLYKFEGKHFRGFSKEQLLSRVNEVSIKLKKAKIIANFKKAKEEDSLVLMFNLGRSPKRLETYLSKLNNEIEKKQLQEGLLKSKRWYELDKTNRSFVIKLSDGSVKPMQFDTKREKHTLFFVFQMLLEQLNKFPENPGLTTGEMVEKLRDKGLLDANKETVKSAITNLRTHKIKSSGLEGYVSIVRRKGKTQLIITIEPQAL